MKIGVFTVLFSQRPFEEALDYIKAAGCEAVEIGVGGYPGPAHANAAALLEDDAARQRFQDAVTSRGLEISALSCHGNPLHPRREIAEAHDRDYRNAVQLAQKLERADGDHLLRLPGRRAGGHGAELGDLPLAAGLHRVARVAVEGAGHDPTGRKRRPTPRSTACGSRSSCTPGSSPTTPIRSTGCARSAARRSASTSIPRTSSGRGWTRWSASAPSGDAIFHVHAKDTWLDEPNIALNGVLDTKPYTDEIHRSWIFRTVGYGHGQEFWRSLISELRLAGYDGAISIEHEDSLMSVNEGFTSAVEFLKDVVIREPAAQAWWT